MDSCFATWSSILIATLISGCQSSSGIDTSAPPDTPEDQLPYTAPINLSNSATYSHDESFTVSADGKIHAFWLDGGDILYASSTDKGATFGVPRLIVPITTAHSYGYPRAAYTSNAIHLAWTVYDSSRGAEIFYARSTDEGGSFSSPRLVSVDDGLNSYASSITSDQDARVGISWNNLENIGANRTRFVISENEGISYSTPSPLPATLGLSPKLLLTTSALYATWSEGGDWTPEIYFAVSTDGGSVFTPPMNISRLPEKSWTGAMARDAAGTLYIVWVEGDAFQDRKIMLTISDDGGQSFSTPVRLSDPATDSFCPSVVAGGMGRFYVTWSSSDDGYITNSSYILASDNGGMTYSPRMKIPMLINDAMCPAISLLDTDQIGMIWNQRAGANGQLPDIFFSIVTMTIP